jgi:CRP/FNR family transcriptional regulator, cyclic AMP receptor protein
MGPPLQHQERIRPLLKRHAVLGRLRDDVLELLLHKGQLKRYAKGEAVYRRGDPGDSLTVLVGGGIKLTIISMQAKEMILHFVGVGEIFGEISALDGKARMLNAVALEASEGFTIHARDLLPALAAHPECLVEIIRSLCERVRVGTSVFENRTLAMRARVARGLLRLARHLGRRRKDGIHLQLAASQEELGNYLGLSRANVNRQLRQLRQAGAVRIDGARIVITDEPVLARLAEAAVSKV